MLKLLLLPLSFLYGVGVRIRNKFFDWKVLPSREFDIPIVCVGNITVGGTGKTPMSELLIDHLSRSYNVALLSRGYKRHSKGFLEIQTDTPYLQSGDEPKQIKLKFPDVVVAVCKDRVEGIERIRELHPQINLIILDDAFQYRRVEAWVNVLLMDYSRPIYKDYLLPYGRLRDTTSQLHRANFIVVNKCPDNINRLDMRIVRKSLELMPYQGLYFSLMNNGQVVPLFPDCASPVVKEGASVIVMAGIASPRPFLEAIKTKYHVEGTLMFADHHAYRMRDLDMMLHALDEAPEGTVIITTEKDAVKLTNRARIPERIQRSLYFIPVYIDFFDCKENEFIEKIEKYVATNHKYSLVHSH